MTQPGATLGWSACLSLNMADETEGQFLLQQMRRRATLSDKDILYLPPEVRDGNLVSGVLASEAVVVKAKSDSGPREIAVVQEKGEQMSVQSTAVEAESIQAEEVKEVNVVEKECEVVLADEKKDLVLIEDDGDSSGGSAQEKGLGDLSVECIRGDIPRTDLALATERDTSLAAVYNLGLNDREGYHVVEGLLFRTRLDMFGDPVEQLCMPASYRNKCLSTAHNSFGHQGRNKMMLLLRPHFYWPNMSHDCQKHVRACERCQKIDKATPKPNSMTEREIVTQPFQDIAIDIVGPFPTAVGGFRYLLTCIDNATRWPEAVPLRSTTARVVISSLTNIFVRCGFPSRLTSDNGSQFTGKTFANWLKAKGIQHTRITPYHPQGNVVIERFHRTLNAIVTKTTEAKGNWAKVVPMVLYFLRCTPSVTTGISPFLATHGWEPATPLQELYQSWVQSDLGGIDLAEWVQVNSERLECARDRATNTKLEVSAKREETWNRKAKDRSFEVGDLVLIRKPGLNLKLRESWEGPGKVLAKNSPLSYKVETDKCVFQTVHIQQLKLFEQPKSVRRVTSVLEADTELDEITQRYAEVKLEPQQLTELQQAQLKSVLDRHEQVLTKEPGLTKLVTFDIDTGEANPVYQRPYNTPVSLRQSVDQEIDWLLGKGYIRPSSSP